MEAHEENVKDSMEPPEPNMEPQARTSEEVRREFGTGMAKHRQFRAHSQEFREALQRHSDALSEIDIAVKDARRRAAVGDSSDATGTGDIEQDMVRLEESRGEEEMVRENLRRDFTELTREFEELKRPENDVVDLQRELQDQNRWPSHRD